MKLKSQTEIFVYGVGQKNVEYESASDEGRLVNRSGRQVTDSNYISRNSDRKLVLNLFSHLLTCQHTKWNQLFDLRNFTNVHSCDVCCWICTAKFPVANICRFVRWFVYKKVYWEKPFITHAYYIIDYWSWVPLFLCVFVVTYCFLCMLNKLSS